MSDSSIEPSLARSAAAPSAHAQYGWNYWRSIWAAWCPTCQQETMPFPSGRCGFCNTHLAGQPTRQAHEPALTAEAVAAGQPDPASISPSASIAA